MTIDEAIEKQKLDNEYNKSIGCDISYEEQITEWLEELKEYQSTLLTPQMIEDLKKSEKQAHKNAIQNAMLAEDSYNKAIDEFANNVICELKSRHTDMPVIDILGTREKWKEKNLQYLECENLVYKIAEQLKEHK